MRVLLRQVLRPLAILAVLSTAPLSQAAAGPPATSQLAEFERWVESFRQSNQIPAISIALAQDEFQWARAFGMADLENQEVGHLARKYMSTMQSVDGLYRARLFHAIRDLTADAFGGWNAVTNIQAGGGLYAQRIVSRMHYDMERAKKVALETAHMSEYIGQV